MEETTEFAVHAGMFPTSMKVFRISGRDPGYSGGLASTLARGLNESLPHKRKRLHCYLLSVHIVGPASMKVFRISGRDLMEDALEPGVPVQPQ